MKKSTLLLFFTFLIAFSAFAQNGLKADYYNGTNFDSYIGTQIETNIDYYWNNVPPMKGIHPNECSVRWTGRLLSPKTGLITFSARVDDGIRMWVGGVQVIDNWQLNDIGYSTGSVKLKEGKYYDIKIEYFNALREAEIKLYWTLPKPDNLSWYDSFWYDDDPKIVAGEYFFQPLKKEVAKVEEEEKEVIAPPKPKKVAPKKKPKSVAPVKPKSKKEIAIESYIPKNVQFERAKTEILPASFAELDRLADFLVKNPHHNIKIEGHTDNVGDAKKNLDLSQSRARAVAAYLIKKGVHHERLSAEGFGGSRPLVKSNGKKYHPENRRVEFIVE